MAPVPITKVISSTSEDTKYPADNILVRKKWLTSQIDYHRDCCEIILQLRIPSIIHFIDIGYINASSLEISVGCSWWPPSRPYEMILTPTVLQTQNEARTGKHKVGCKMFNCPEHLNSDVCEGKWDRVKIILKQIYSKNKQMGLEFVRISNSRNVKLKKTSDSAIPSSTDDPVESLGGNIWKNSSLARLRQVESKESLEIDILKDKLLRISGTTEDGSSNENTLTRTAKMVLSSRATSNQPTPKRHNFKSTGTVSTNQAKDIDTSNEATISRSTSFTTASPKSSNPRSSTQSKAINSINGTSEGSFSQVRPHHSGIKSPNSNGNDERGLKSSSLLKTVTLKGKPQITSGKPHCDAIKSPKILSSRLPTPKSKCAAMVSYSTSEGKSYPSPHCDIIKSNHDVNIMISPRNERNTQVRRASLNITSPQTESPKAKRCLKLKPALSPSTNSNNDSVKLKNDDVAMLSGNQTAELPTTSKSAPSPKLYPKSVKVDPTSPKVSSLRKAPVIANDGISGNHLVAAVIETHSDVSMETADLTKSEIRKIKKKIERFFNSLDMHEMDPDNVTLKELRVGFEVTNNLKLDKHGRDYFRNATANFLDLVMNVQQSKNNGKESPRSIERKRKNHSEIATSSKSRRLSSDVEDCEINQTAQGVQCPICLQYFPQDVVTDHAALCGDDEMQSGSRDVEIVSTSSSQQQHPRETFIDLSDNMGLTDAEKQRWLNFSCKPKPYHPRMDKSLFQGHQLVKCPTCGQYYKANEIQEHGDECAEKVNSGFVKRGLYFVKKGL